MRISHVVRGEEHLMNGFKQAVLFDALGARPPRFAHIPLILGKDGRKLSKREAVTNVLEYRDRGYLPEAVFNYITLLGWRFSGDRDVFTREEMLTRFRIEDIGASGAKFDEEKLRWMSGDYLRRLSRDELVARARPFLAGIVPDGAFDRAPDFVANVIACYQPRVDLLAELRDRVDWVFVDELEIDAGARRTVAKRPAAGEWLRAYADLLEASDLPPSWPEERSAADRAFPLPSAPDDVRPDAAPCAGPLELEAQCREFAAERGIKFGHLVHPLRA